MKSHLYLKCLIAMIFRMGNHPPWLVSSPTIMLLVRAGEDTSQGGNTYIRKPGIVIQVDPDRGYYFHFKTSFLPLPVFPSQTPNRSGGRSKL
ncbi:hypothetical protein QE357_003577 [Siphonobacter sp. BAB-5404]|nr:hypothetical protein [Siphonobacter sp. SORGH_AS_0500]